MTRTQVVCTSAPRPVGTYSQAIAARGLIFLSGQTPRDLRGKRLTEKPFDDQVTAALDHLEEVARAAGSSLRNAVKVNVYLKDIRLAADFDRLYGRYVGTPPPARTLTQSDLPGIGVEVDAILLDLGVAGDVSAR